MKNVIKTENMESSFTQTYVLKTVDSNWRLAKLSYSFIVGSHLGLSLTLNVEQYEHVQRRNMDAGIKVHCFNVIEIRLCVLRSMLSYSANIKLTLKTCFFPTVREGYFFRSVWQSFCSSGGGEGVCPTPPGGRPPWLQSPPPPDADPLPRIQTPSGCRPLVAATAAVGTHPTGMHSCFQIHLHYQLDVPTVRDLGAGVPLASHSLVRIRYTVVRYKFF